MERCALQPFAADWDAAEVMFVDLSLSPFARPVADLGVAVPDVVVAASIPAAPPAECTSAASGRADLAAVRLVAYK